MLPTLPSPADRVRDIIHCLMHAGTHDGRLVMCATLNLDDGGSARRSADSFERVRAGTVARQGGRSAAA